MTCTKCKREINQGDTYVTIKSEVEVATGSEPTKIDSVTIILHCMNCIIYADVQLHSCLESYHEALRN